MGTKLTATERSTLERMVSLHDRSGFDGMGATGSAGIQRMRRLDARGLVRFVDYGAIEDCEAGGCKDGCREGHPIYAITDAGRAALAAE